MSEEKEHLTRGHRAVRTKGPEGVSRGALEAASTKKISKAQKLLVTIAAKLEEVQDLLAKVETKDKRAKKAKQGRKSPAE